MKLLRVVTQGLLSCALFACAPAADESDPPVLPQEATADAGDAPTGACDRACLLEHMQKYLDALVAKDFKRLPVASSLKYTENGRVVQAGDGLFKTATALVPKARLDFADPVLGNVVTQVVVNEGTQPVLYMARLKLVNHQITEIEAMAVRRQGAANGFFNASKLVPEPAFLEPVPADKRMSREQLNVVLEQYLDYLEGKKRGNQVPFAPTCKRYENGQVTASGLSSFNLQSWSFRLTRRTLVLDEESGIAWGMYPFTQSATSLVVGEAFKIVDGKITMIQAIMANQPAKVWN